MRIVYILALFLFTISLAAQKKLSNLTVETIMRDPKWIGIWPSQPRYDIASQLYFRCNPDESISDSLYYLKDQKLAKVSFSSEKEIIWVDECILSTNDSFVISEKEGDLFLIDLFNSKKTQLTKTSEFETNPKFSADNQSIFFQKGENLFQWHLFERNITQLTDIRRNSRYNKDKPEPSKSRLESEQLELFKTLRESETQEEKRQQTFKLSEKEKGVFFLDKLDLRAISASPALMATTLITQEAKNSLEKNKQTEIPDYVTVSGYTEHENVREKVGNPVQPTSLWILHKDSLRYVKWNFNFLPGINIEPAYRKLYSGESDTTRKRSYSKDLVIHKPTWSPDGQKALIQLYSTDCKDRYIVLYDASKNQTSLIDHQHDEAWIGGPGIGSVYVAGKSGWTKNGDLWFLSERTGYAHLYLFEVKKNKIVPLTSGQFEISEVTETLHKERIIYLSNESHPGKKSINYYSFSDNKNHLIFKSDGGIKDLTYSNGKLAFLFSPGPTSPWEVYEKDLNTSQDLVRITHMASSKEFESFPWLAPKIITIPNETGQPIYTRIYEPQPSKSNGAAVIFVHGAGYLQNAHNWWSLYFREFMFHNLLTAQGYTVLDMDYRASAGYGRDWRTAIYRHMGGADLNDILSGRAYLIDRLKISADKIGIYGGSYGGFITLMALFTQPGDFKAGAALRPVTDWAHYNHGYTSNILNTPSSDSLAYRRSSPIFFADGLQDHLLICHGMLDDNVHFQDVVRLQQKLIELGKDNWEVAAYPLERHGFKYADAWTDEYKRILKLFNRELLQKP